MTLYCRPKVIADLAGISYPQVMRDIARFDWEKKKRPTSTLDFFNLDDVMRSYGRVWPKENIQIAIARHDKPAAIEN